MLLILLACWRSKSHRADESDKNSLFFSPLGSLVLLRVESGEAISIKCAKGKLNCNVRKVTFGTEVTSRDFA
jgi:hypothetical protein